MISIRNERRKHLATPLNNLGVASIVTGGIAPAAASLVGSLPLDDPYRLASIIIIWLAIGIAMMLAAQRVLMELE